MKTVAVTVAVLALGLAACQKNADTNVANETAVENSADMDVNAATNDVGASADAALNAAGNDVGNVVDAANSAANAVDNTTK